MSNDIYICGRARIFQIGGIAPIPPCAFISTVAENPGEQYIGFASKFQVGLYQGLILRSIAQENCIQND